MITSSLIACETLLALAVLRKYKTLVGLKTKKFFSHIWRDVPAWLVSDEVSFLDLWKTYFSVFLHSEERERQHVLWFPSFKTTKPLIESPPSLPHRNPIIF
jgi:hypothetical protein